MATPTERKALLFLAAIALLGAGVRWAHAVRGGPADTPDQRRALGAQIAAVDSAAARQGTKLSRPPSASAKAAAPRAAAPPASARSRSSVPPPPRATAPPQPVHVDADRATAQELDALPRIGPVLAKRIVADRDSLGPFGSLDNLQRVKGIGPAVARALAPFVVFSGTPRPQAVTRRTERAK